MSFSIVFVMRDELLLAAGGYLYFIHYLDIFSHFNIFLQMD